MPYYVDDVRQGKVWSSLNTTGREALAPGAADSKLSLAYGEIRFCIDTSIPGIYAIKPSNYAVDATSANIMIWLQSSNPRGRGCSASLFKAIKVVDMSKQR